MWAVRYIGGKIPVQATDAMHKLLPYLCLAALAACASTPPGLSAHLQPGACAPDLAQYSYGCGQAVPDYSYSYPDYGGSGPAGVYYPGIALPLPAVTPPPPVKAPPPAPPPPPPKATRPVPDIRPCPAGDKACP